jgi:hypothetical protein
MSIWSQVHDVGALEYARTVDTPVHKEKAARLTDYSQVEVYENPVANLLTHSTLLLSMLFWLPVVGYMLDGYTASSGMVIGLIYGLCGFVWWFVYAYHFHRLHHTEVDQKWATSYWRRLWHFNGHGYHHMFPHDPRRIVIHPMIASCAILPTIYAGSWVAATHYRIFMAGLILGHLFVEVVHFSLHYDTMLTPYVKPLQHHHMCHHYKIPHRFFAYGHKLEDTIWTKVLGDVPMPVHKVGGSFF